MVYDYFILALRSIRHKSTRSYLTIIGILIGVAAIVALLSVSQGINQSVREEFEEAGTDTITVQVDTIDDTLSENDADFVRGIRGVDTVEPLLMHGGEVGFSGETESTMIIGGEPGIFDVFPQFDVVEGREIRENERSNALVGDDVYPGLFDNEVNLNNRVDIEERSFRVVGKLDTFGGGPFSEQSLFISLERAQELFDMEGEISMIYVEPSDGFEVSEVADRIDEELEDERGDDDFSVQTLEQILEAVENILGMVQALFIGIASISILVGGVGIMNTMFSSVIEKTREIGIMKAVGARNSDVLFVFMFESGLLGLGGGIAGILLGLGMAFGARGFIQDVAGLGTLNIAITPEIILGSLLFSFLLGTISGVLPARKAAKMKPVDALRSE